MSEKIHRIHVEVDIFWAGKLPDEDDPDFLEALEEEVGLGNGQITSFPVTSPAKLPVKILDSIPWGSESSLSIKEQLRQ